MSPYKAYLGDGVYVDFDGHRLTLTTEDGINTSNTIVIEPEVWLALLRYRTALGRLWETGKERTRR